MIITNYIEQKEVCYPFRPSEDSLFFSITRCFKDALIDIQESEDSEEILTEELEDSFCYLQSFKVDNIGEASLVFKAYQRELNTSVFYTKEIVFTVPKEDKGIQLYRKDLSVIIVNVDQLRQTTQFTNITDNSKYRLESFLISIDMIHLTKIGFYNEPRYERKSKRDSMSVNEILETDPVYTFTDSPKIKNGYNLEVWQDKNNIGILGYSGGGLGKSPHNMWIDTINSPSRESDKYLKSINGILPKDGNIILHTEKSISISAQGNGLFIKNKATASARPSGGYSESISTGRYNNYDCQGIIPLKLACDDCSDNKLNQLPTEITGEVSLEILHPSAYINRDILYPNECNKPYEIGFIRPEDKRPHLDTRSLSLIIPDGNPLPIHQFKNFQGKLNTQLDMIRNKIDLVHAHIGDVIRQTFPTVYGGGVGKVSYTCQVCYEGNLTDGLYVYDNEGEEIYEWHGVNFLESSGNLKQVNSVSIPAKHVEESYRSCDPFFGEDGEDGEPIAEELKNPVIAFSYCPKYEVQRVASITCENGNVFKDVANIPI